tara:strand:+ start:354 stop:1316 length:963 start_codon:yes stop_codon:yes gene_type:complete
MTTSKTKYKINTQLSYVPKMVAPLTNGETSSAINNNYNYAGNWYPKARPLKQYRKRGSTYSLGTDATGSYYLNCNNCDNVNLTIGKSFKLLGKDANGENKELRLNPSPIVDDDGCLISNPTRGPRGTKSAGAKIRSSTTLIPLSNNYYSNRQSYLQSRGKAFSDKQILSKMDGATVTYYDADGNWLWPTDDNPTSHYLGKNRNTPSTVTNSSNCSITIYKPNNRQYGVQGAVDSSSRLERLKLNTITKNYSTFYKTDSWGSGDFKTTENPNLYYTGNATAPYFIKSKVTQPKMFHKRGKKTMCGNCSSNTGKIGYSMTFF